LVALAFAVAASANFPCVLLTLYWKRCNTGGIVLGMIVGTLTAIGLVPYRNDLSEADQGGGAVDGAVPRIEKLQADLATAADDPAKAKAQKAIAGVEEVAPRGNLDDSRRRHECESKPLFECAIGPHFHSAGLPRHDPRLIARRDDARKTCGTSYVRQNTGLASPRPPRDERHFVARQPAARGGCRYAILRG
jgi:hypothetical protein